MAINIILRVGDGASQDIPLTSGGVNVLAPYALVTPEVDLATIQNLGDGESLSVPRWREVTESLELHIRDVSAAAVAARVRGIENLLNLARQGTMGWLDDRVFLRVQFDHDSLAWRSQILAGKLDVPGGSEQIWRNYVRATLVITRRYYWETEALQELQATSGPTGTPTTEFVTVYNNDDTHGTNRNWWRIAGAQVQGSIPAPATISIRNNSGATRAGATFYLGNYVLTHPEVDPIYRHGDAAGTSGTTTTTETDIAYWHLGGSNLMSAFRGQPGRILVVWNARPEPTTMVRAAFQFRGPVPVVDLAQGEYVLSPGADYVADLGPLPLPPGGAYANMGDRLYITLKGVAAAGSDAITVDWMQIFPAGVGRYRMIKAAYGGAGVTNGDMLVDDGSRGQVYYHAASGGHHYPVFQPFFDPIYLWPGRANVLRLIISGNTSFEAGQPWQVRTQYRPRRLSF